MLLKFDLKQRNERMEIKKTGWVVVEGERISKDSFHGRNTRGGEKERERGDYTQVEEADEARGQRGRAVKRHKLRAHASSSIDSSFFLLKSISSLSSSTRLSLDRFSDEENEKREREKVGRKCQ